MAICFAFLSIGLVWSVPTSVFAPDPCSALAVCIHAGVFQPVQTVWQDDALYPPNDLTPGGPGGLPPIDSGDNIHWNATFPIIAGKNTYLFGTLGDYDGNRSTINIFVSDTFPAGGADPVELQISVTPPGTVIYTSPMFMVPRGGSILYNLPAPLPSIPFQLSGRGLHEIRMKTILTNSANQLIVYTKVDIPQSGLDLVYAPMAFDGDIAPGGGPVAGVTLPTGNDFNTMVLESSRFVRAVYPLNETALRVQTFPNLFQFSNASSGGTVAERDALRFRLIGDYFEARAQSIEQISGRWTEIVVVVPDYHAHSPDKSWKQHWFGGTVRPGESYGPDDPNVVFVELGYWEVVAHELTHNLVGSVHDNNVADGYWVNANAEQQDGGAPAVCKVGPSGIAGTCVPRASLQNVPVNSSATILFYHSLSGLWIAKKNVDASLMRFECHCSPFDLSDPSVVAVSGKIFANQTGSFDNFYKLPRGTPDLALGDVGNYSIVFRDSGGSLLGTAGFNASLTFTPDAFEPNPASITLNPSSFSFVLPWINGTQTIQLVNSTGYVLDSRTISGNVLSLTVNSPNGGETFPSGSVQTVSWTASGANGFPLTYSVLYSGDNGTSWLPIGVNVNATSIPWNLTGVPAGTNYLVGVIATDGVNTGEGLSASTFSVTQATAGDFSLSATSACSGSSCAPAGTITLTSIGFTGTVTLTDDVPYALSCGPITPDTLTIPPSPATALLSCTSSTVGNYTIIITATSGGLVHSSNLSFTCPTIGTACSSAVGGELVPVDKSNLLASYSIFAYLIATAALLTLCMQRRWRGARRILKQQIPLSQGM